MKKKYLLLSSFLFALSISGCKTENIEEQEHKHVFSESWTFDSKNHWHNSMCGHAVVSDKAPHVLGDWEIETPETETSEGIKFRKCTTCDYRIQETLP